MKTITFTEKLITPSMAREILEANIKNRRLKTPKVLQYANDITAGRWKRGTAETMKIASTGRVLDGQQRLNAIIKANKAIWVHIAYDLDESVFDVLDTGSSRNATDVFKIENIQHENMIPSIISFYNMLVAGRRTSAQVNKKSTNALLLEQYYLDEKFWQSVAKLSSRWYKAFAKILSPSMIGGFYAHLFKIDESAAFDFMEQMTTGMNIKNTTIALLRNRLMQDKVSPRKMTSATKMAIIIKTWNCFVSDENVKILKFDTARDEFPKAKKTNLLTTKN